MSETKSAWSPRYLAYCRATGGLSPQASLERDRAAYPGGSMAGFLTWGRASTPTEYPE